MKLIYAQGFSKTEKLEWKPVVFNNVVQSMRVIFDAMSDYSIEFENKDNEVCVSWLCGYVFIEFEYGYEFPGDSETWLPTSLPS